MEIKSCGGTIGTTEVITQLLSAMTESYQPVVTAIDIIFTQNPAGITLD